MDQERRHPDIFRLDLKTGEWEKFHPTDQLPGVKNAGIYQVMADSKNNLWMAEFTEGHLGKIDAKTAQGDVVCDADPACPRSPHGNRQPGPRHGDRISHQQGRAVRSPRPRSSPSTACPNTPIPYRAEFDKNGEIWASTMSTDRVVRMDPKTGKTEQYLMPSDTNMRTVCLDNTTTPVTFWVGSNHDHGWSRSSRWTDFHHHAWTTSLSLPSREGEFFHVHTRPGIAKTRLHPAALILRWPRSGPRRMLPRRCGPRPSRLASLAPQGEGMSNVQSGCSADIRFVVHALTLSPVRERV